MVSFQQLKSTQILDDCQRSLDLLEQVPDGDKQLFRIYCNHLIHVEQNTAVHKVKQTYSDPRTFLGPDGSFDLGDIYLPMGDNDLWGDWDCRDWLKEGVDWWRKEIKSYAKNLSNEDCHLKKEAFMSRGAGGHEIDFTKSHSGESR